MSDRSDPSRPSVSLTDPRTLVGAMRMAGRSRPARVVVALLLALALTQLGRHADDRAAARQRAWEPGADVWVATAAIDAGALLTDANTAARRLPTIAIPADALTDAPAGRRSAVDLVEGEILRAARVGEAGRLASQLQPDEGIVTLGSDAAHLSAGDRVDLYALLTGDVVARSARVIDVEADRALVAVAESALPAVIGTFTTGDVVAVLVG